MLLSRTEGAVTIGIDPYFDVQRQKAVFDENLLDEDVLAVRVHVRNAGPGRVVFLPSDMAIELPDGRSLLPSSAAIVAMKVTGGTGSVIASGIVFGGIGFAVAWNAREKAKADRIKDYVEKELQTVTLSQDESRHGFVFFIGPPKLAFREGTLAVRFIEAEGGTTKMVRLSLAETNPSGVPDGR
ncbi:MAG: hypothetical protein A2X51_12820 [Candidatus Rokubacteria bacterium GWC2_70_24]|nr:MAG: hypothetical protein A2X53_06095 [Candidatus Rokubacteria bacterium GWA2_70_23]OGK92297.1 MAG: hypothetical protein A2X51_12820 [Candidatus Rokubacteria bacterium GWC2_70_24]